MIRRLFRQMMITQIVSSMTVTLCMLIDSIMIGQFLGTDAMAAYGFTQPVLLAFAAPGAMISAGVQVVCGKTMGSGDREGTDACFTVSAALTALIAALGLLVVLCFSGPITTLLGAGDIGREVAIRLRAFGPTWLAGVNRRGGNPEDRALREVSRGSP